MNEQVFYDNGVVSVTSARCLLGGKTVPIRSLNAVSMLVKSPNRIPPIILIVLGIVFLCIKVWLLGIIFVAGGAAWYYFQKNRYFVHIETASGSSDLYSSKDEAHIQEIVDALNNAIISQAK